MRELRYVGPASDPAHLVVETADGAERFRLPVSAALHDATQTDLLGELPPSLGPTADAGPSPGPHRPLSPRDIQVRVRAGESPESLAAETGNDLQRIMCFAGPVLDERMRVTDEARRGRARRSDADGRTVVFGAAVDARFTAHGLDPTAVRWDARRHGDSQWVVSAQWSDGETERHAEWGFTLATRTAAPLDDSATELLSERPIRPVEETPSRPTLTVAPPLAPDVVDFPAVPDAYPGPVPGREDVFDQEAFDNDDRPAERSPAELPLELAAPAAERADEQVTDPKPITTRRGRTQKPTMPSWDDILMGVRRKTD
jgi:Protein of unknown function (DUF3071)